MIGVTNNSPQQINAALIALKNEVKKEITEITNEHIEQVESNIIDDSAPSLDTTYSSQKIESELSNLPTYPEGYVYQQLYRTPNPAQMNMRVPDGCAWVDISKQYSGDYFRVKGPRWHDQMATVSVKVVAYDASTMTVTIESGIIVNGCVWNRDVVRNNNTGDCAWALARTNETIDGITYNKTYTLDRDISLTVGQYISLSHGDATQAHRHSGTTEPDGNHQHTSNVDVALGNAAGSNAWCLVPRNKQYDGGLSGTSRWSGIHTHTMTTGGIQAIGSELAQTINSRDETRVQCTFMIIWQVQEI